MLRVLPLILITAPAVGDLDDARDAFREGRYRECRIATIAGIAEDLRDEEWQTLHLRTLRVLGDCEAAAAAVDAALEECTRDLGVRLEAYRLLRACGETERAAEVLDDAGEMGRRYKYRYRDAEDQVVLGEIELARGRDAREVLDTYFTPSKLDEPELVAPRRAIAELALSKHDYALAADELRAALSAGGEDPDLLVLLARALAPSDGAGAQAAIGRALAINPNHPGALLKTVDGHVGGERYELARPSLEKVLAVDPGHPEAWAWSAVIAHLEGNVAREEACRATALERWNENPAVDWLIGRELAEKYRFAEAAAAQRRALAFDPTHAEARFELAQNLLRLGRVDEGWSLAEYVADQDPYHVVAYNLMLLRDVLAGYTTLEGEGVIVRMAPEEAAVYGARVLELLAEARAELAARYEVELDGPLTLELFAQQSDFAVRTFGLPGGEGFLGVCFGDVITMKSPVTQGEDPANWEAVLWHELCHAITLNKTRNRMPRWLSEGISVREERRRDPSWGQDMLPAYRSRILAGEAWALEELGGAFRRPRGPLGLQFAYYQSSLAVEYLVETHGFDALLAVLDRLAGTAGIDAALAPYAGLSDGFAAWLRARAEARWPGLTWEPLEFSRRDVEGLAEFVAAHPRNPIGLNRYADALAGAGRADEARATLVRSLELCPELLGPGCAYEQLAALHETAGDVDAELAVLDDWLARESDALGARLRRMELRAEREEWPAALDAARGVLAVQPMLAAAHRVRGRAALALGRHEDALAAGRAELALGPVAPARVHLQVAQAARALGDLATARRQVLMALEEAPRFREAHALLLELQDG